MTTEAKNRECKQKIADLLSNYKDGQDIFKNANAAKNWDYPVEKIEGAEGNPDLPSSWLELAEHVIGIIAKEKYDLDVYENAIHVVKSDQMLDAYASVGLPVSYEHWSFGKQRVTSEEQYKKGRMGLAYELVINSDPAIAYCMENNSPLMQLLVIAHASFGHNNFFKNNHLFKQFTEAKNIIIDLQNMRDFIRECEEKFGYEEVEKTLDACHALRSHGVDRYTKPEPKTRQEMMAKAKQEYVNRASKPVVSSIYDGIRKKFNESANDNEKVKPGFQEENLLKYLADNAPHLAGWQRRILKMSADLAQYFYPQMQTKLMNEGWASTWHYTLLHDLRELDLIDDGMMVEFLESHSGVLFQPEFDETRKVMTPDGQIKEVKIYNGINPYALGFAIFQDIKRICLEPTDEDREWFPHLAGNQDWLGAWKEAMENFKDESFVLQYLSPKVMRDFKFFAMEDNSENKYQEIIAIHDSKGFRAVRETLASNYRLADSQPRIEVHEYHDRTDRRLVLHHNMYDNKPLDQKDMSEVMKHLYYLWQHPVELKSINSEGKHKHTFEVQPDKCRSFDIT